MIMKILIVIVIAIFLILVGAIGVLVAIGNCMFRK